MDEILLPGTNTGALIRQPSGKDFVKGYNSPFDNMPDLEQSWMHLKSIDIRQSKPGFYDTFGCTDYGYLSVVEPQINRMIRTGIIRPDFLNFLQTNHYLDANGNIVCSRAALGVMSNLGPNGNYLDLVANTARTKGLVPEALHPSDPALFNSQAEWLRPVPQNLLDIAKQFQTFIDLAYDIDYGGQAYAPAHVKKAPLYIALGVCSPWQQDGPVPWCGRLQTDHALALYEDSDPNPPVCQDSYFPFTRKLSLDYQIPYLIQVFAIQKKDITPMYGFKKASSPVVYILYGAVAVPVADWSAFVDMGGSTATIITLPDAEFAKLKITAIAKFNK